MELCKAFHKNIVRSPLQIHPRSAPAGDCLQFRKNYTILRPDFSHSFTNRRRCTGRYSSTVSVCDSLSFFGLFVRCDNLGSISLLQMNWRVVTTLIPRRCTPGITNLYHALFRNSWVYITRLSHFFQHVQYRRLLSVVTRSWARPVIDDP